MKITHVKPLPDRMMLLTFSSGETRLFDAAVLDGPVFSDLQNEDVFFSPVLDHGVVTWNDGEIDCDPEYMYEHSYEYSVAG
ncbi:MAG: DUF2442 domain-containing protein [Oscillospiraceae bacterium]|nr:DUF2442 domain-containing protein [Oscillospiraceae bacterium]